LIRLPRDFSRLHAIDENIADLGGIAAAYDGYRASLHGAEAPTRHGFTGDQQLDRRSILLPTTE